MENGGDRRIAVAYGDWPREEFEVANRNNSHRVGGGDDGIGRIGIVDGADDEQHAGRFRQLLNDG
jgi:hypothetical protein